MDTKKIAAISAIIATTAVAGSASAQEVPDINVNVDNASTSYSVGGGGNSGTTKSGHGGFLGTGANMNIGVGGAQSNPVSNPGSSVYTDECGNQYSVPNKASGFNIMGWIAGQSTRAGEPLSEQQITFFSCKVNKNNLLVFMSGNPDMDGYRGRVVGALYNYMRITGKLTGETIKNGTKMSLSEYYRPVMTGTRAGERLSKKDMFTLQEEVLSVYFSLDDSFIEERVNTKQQVVETPPVVETPVVQQQQVVETPPVDNPVTGTGEIDFKQYTQGHNLSEEYVKKNQDYLKKHYPDGKIQYAPGITETAQDSDGLKNRLPLGGQVYFRNTNSGAYFKKGEPGTTYSITRDANGDYHVVKN